ncbi:cytochrome c [Vibrio splendidus]|nr:cytochrome c [Vibrio splendidus]
MAYQSFALILLTLSSSLYAADFGNPDLGKMKSPSCVFCHNLSTHQPINPSTNSIYPNLSGQDALYLFNTMKAYQNGERLGDYATMRLCDYAEMMRAQLSKLNDQDFKNIAAFYSYLENK